MVQSAVGCTFDVILTAGCTFDMTKFGQQQLVMVNYTIWSSGFNQSETGKYFERIMNIYTLLSNSDLINLQVLILIICFSAGI